MKRVLFLTGERACACCWSAGRFRAAQVFSTDADGLADCVGMLRGSAGAAVHIVIDLIEDEFRSESMPRVFGRDRRALGERLLARHFRTTVYRRISVQGRDGTERGALRVLLSGVANPELVNRWVDALTAAGVPVSGIYSAPLLGERLLPHIRAAASRVLLVWQPSPGALRQSFYDHGRLRLSRQVALRCDPAEGVSGPLRRDLHDTRQFLETQRLIPPGERLRVHVLATAGQARALRQVLSDDQAVRYGFSACDSLAAALGVRGALPGPFVDGLFVQLLLRQTWPVIHYAAPAMRRRQAQRRARAGLHASAVTVLAVSLAFGAARLNEGRFYDSGTVNASIEIQRYDRLHDDLSRELQTLPGSAAAVRHTVELVRALDRVALTSPALLMSRLSAVFDDHPHVQVSGLQWTAIPDRGSSPRHDEIAALVAVRHETALITGRVVGSGPGYRAASGHFDRFVAALRAMPGVETAQTRRTPFDMDPDVALVGESGTHADAVRAPAAAYEILVTMRAGGDPG